jgi:hypothetical protein
MWIDLIERFTCSRLSSVQQYSGVDKEWGLVTREYAKEFEARDKLREERKQRLAKQGNSGIRPALGRPMYDAAKRGLGKLREIKQQERSKNRGNVFTRPR